MVKLPYVAALELTYRCNHRCVFCSCPWEAGSVEKLGELNIDQWISILHALRKRGVNTVSLTGGEPTLKEGFLDIIDAARGLKMQTCMITNGRNMYNDLLRELKSKQVRLSISVPGIDTFEDQTGYDGVEHVMSLFRVARDIGMDVTANIAVTKLNLPELYETIAYSLVNGAQYVLLNRFLPGGRGLQNEEYLLDSEEINTMLDTAEEVLQKAGRKGHVGTELPYCIVRNPKRYKQLSISYQCGAAKSFFAIDPSGYVKVCNHSEVRLRHVSEIDMLEDDPYWSAFTNRDYIPTNCDGCKDVRRCDGGCREAAHIYRGNIASLDPCMT